MKKIMFVIVLLLVSGFVQAESWLSVEWAFQFGWIPYGNLSLFSTCSELVSEPFDIVFKIDAKIFNFVKIGGNTVSMFNRIEYGVSPIDFMPTGISYLFYFGIEPIKGISINYEHSCSHPIIPYLSNTFGKAEITAGYDRIYFEIKGNIDY
jgi:hypothetical protein